MKVIRIDNSNEPIEFAKNGARVILASEMNLSYLQGIRDVEGIDTHLIGSNGSEIQFVGEIPC